MFIVLTVLGNYCLKFTGRMLALLILTFIMYVILNMKLLECDHFCVAHSAAGRVAVRQTQLQYNEQIYHQPRKSQVDDEYAEGEVQKYSV